MRRRPDCGLASNKKETKRGGVGWGGERKDPSSPFQMEISLPKKMLISIQLTDASKIHEEEGQVCVCVCWGASASNQEDPQTHSTGGEERMGLLALFLLFLWLTLWRRI